MFITIFFYVTQWYALLDFEINQGTKEQVPHLPLIANVFVN